jgi:hypothetical protein
MDFLHKREYLNTGDIVVVECSHQCNIMLLDDINFSYYQRGQQFKYFGGFYEYFPARIIAPHNGNWNIVLDLGGGAANILHNITIIRNS